MEAKIIILTPVKNEDWILEQFLTISSLFADCIIVADQNSTDLSREICKKFSKVIMISNSTVDFNEAERQTMLIEKARELFPASKRILFALDADELFSANCLNQEMVWEKIRELAPGTTIYIEKPDILNGHKRCARAKENYAALGYVDDGYSHRPAAIHSTRVPVNPGGQKIYIDDLKILHFAHSRKNVQSAKLRFYSVLENAKNTKPFYRRRFIYNSFYKESLMYPENAIEEVPEDWVSGWERMKINLCNFPEPIYSWHDMEVLHFFKKFGYSRFYLDDIWEFDWESCRIWAMKNGKEAPVVSVKKPGPMLGVLAKAADRLYRFSRFVRNI